MSEIEKTEDLIDPELRDAFVLACQQRARDVRASYAATAVDMRLKMEEEVFKVAADELVSLLRGGNFFAVRRDGGFLISRAPSKAVGGM